MKTNVIPIGNSKGIRIPSSLLKICQISSEVDMDVKGHTLMIRPIKKKLRNGWAEALQEMHLRKEDQLLIDDRIDFSMENWEW